MSSLAPRQNGEEKELELGAGERRRGYSGYDEESVAKMHSRDIGRIGMQVERVISQKFESKEEEKAPEKQAP